MSDEYILDDVVETFSDEDTLMSDIRNNPVKWLLSMAVLGPGMAYTMTEQSSYGAALENWGLPTGLEWILAVFVTGQLFIAPLSCYYLSRSGNAASGLFIAMGGAAILVANPDEIARFSETLGAPFALFCVALSTPLLMVLKNKKKLLDPGKERLTWCTLISTAIMMYTVAAIVPSAGVAIADVSCEEDAGALLSEVDVFAGATDACEALQYRYAPILGMAAAIGWAWPRGKKIIDDLSDDFLDGLKDIGPGGGDDGNDPTGNGVAETRSGGDGLGQRSDLSTNSIWLMPVAIIGLLVGGQLIGVIDVNGSGNNLGEGPFEELIFDNTAMNVPTFKFIDYFGEKAFLIQNSEVATDIGIYTTDGTTAGTQKVWSPPNNLPFRYISEIGTSFLFQFNAELWKSDGTAAGTQQVFDFSMYHDVYAFTWTTSFVGIRTVTEFESLSQTGQANLWVSDGTTLGTTQIYDFQDFGFLNNVVHNDVLYFTANDSISGMEVWASDGTTSGTSIHYESNVGFDGAFFNELDVVGNRLWWHQAHVNASSAQLMASDMDGSNVELLAEIGNFGGFLHRSSQNRVYYWDHSLNNADLYATDGTISGTTVVGQGVMTQQMVGIYWVWEFDGNVMLSLGLSQDWARIYTIDSAGTMTQFDDYIETRFSLDIGNELLFTGAKDGVDRCELRGNSGSFCGGSTLFLTNGTVGNTELFLEAGVKGDITPLQYSDGMLFYTRDSVGLYATNLNQAIRIGGPYDYTRNGTDPILDGLKD